MQNVTYLQNENASLKTHIQHLESYIRALKQKQFGSSSEKQNIHQPGLFNEAEAEAFETDTDDTAESEKAASVIKPVSPKKPRVSIPKDLPRERIIYDLDEADKVCPHDGSALKNIGEATHEQVEIIPAQVKVIQHVCLKYACPTCDQHILTAKKPKQPIEKSIASPSLLAYVATQKYCDALPLYRQTESFKRIGIDLNRSNLANWMIKSGELLQPLINLLQDKILEQGIVHMDETPVQVLNEAGKTAQSKSYMWELASFNKDQPAVLFHYDPTRKADVPKEMLGDYQGALMVDGYSGYQSVCVDNELTRLGCMAHARRKFIDVQKTQGKKANDKNSKANQAIAYFQKLYQIEKAIKDKTDDVRYTIRQQQAKPLVDKLKIWLEKHLPNVPPNSTLGKALYYLHHQWPRLIVYLEDGAYPIDNNLAENAIRPFAIGRKNWLFSTSQAGARASANLYSMVETAKANGINPYTYLEYIFKELPNATTVESIEALLPWHYKTTLENR
jgi:transposase